MQEKKQRNNRNQRRNRKKASPKLKRMDAQMKMKLVWLFGIVILALVGLCIRITYINASQGNKYKKQVLSQSQQKYDSTTIPFKRGDILDKNGVVLATSKKVYNVILDCKVVNSDERYIEPTVRVLEEQLGLSGEDITKLLEDEETKTSQYQVVLENLSMEEKEAFEAFLDTSSEENANLSKEEKTRRLRVKGVWFEDDYQRVYPLNTTACELVGFQTENDSGSTGTGIEGYYNSTLDGVNGRRYGYFNSDEDVEQTIIDPIEGNSVVSTIDVNVQQMVENNIQEFMDGMADGPNGDKGAENVGVIVMNPNNGEILAMASDSPFDLNSPRDLSAYLTEEEVAGMTQQELSDAYLKYWRNYCVSESFEPGSTIKPLTIAGALQANAISTDDTFVCDGYEMFGTQKINCSVYPNNHGEQTLGEVLKHSCNDGLMQIAELMGPEDFLKYQKIFNLGSKTGIDLPGESSGILHSEETLSRRSTELASASFGQGYNCTMIQEIAAICSVINGGYYYQPHVISKILDEDGNAVENIEPVLQSQTVSADVSATIRGYMGEVMASDGTGYGAKIDGYSMGGKTGTAEKMPRDKEKYLVSFIGFAPLNDPQVVVYVVVDEPNVEYQADSTYAQYIYKQVMKELLPYMNIFPDEELTGKESENVSYMEYLIPQKAQQHRENAANGLEDAGTGEPVTSDPAMQEATDNPDVPGPPEGEAEPDQTTTRESDGITNSDAEQNLRE